VKYNGTKGVCQVVPSVPHAGAHLGFILPAIYGSRHWLFYQTLRDYG